MQSPWQNLAQRFHSLSVARRRFLLLSGALLTLVFLMFVSAGKDGKSSPSLGISPQPAATALPLRSPAAPIGNDKDFGAIALPPGSYPVRSDELFHPSTEPRVSYSAELSVVTRDFAHARSSTEEILDRHRGYTAKLRMVGQPAGSILSATLRVPASEYNSALAELKSIGSVERDEESADEIVQQHGDLEARLQNAQNAEHRLQQLLQEKSVQPGALTPVEQQLSQLRNEIERMKAEERTYDNRAVFSNIYFSIREERLAPAETFSSQLRGAAAAGLFDAFRILSSILLFCVNYGPSLILWAAILFFPFRMLWRRSRTAVVGTSA